MRKVYIVGLVAVALLVIGIAIADEIKFSTYYPAPFGMYREFSATGKTTLATDEWGIEGDNARVGIGTTDPGTAKLAVIGGNVGIGTVSPDYKLDVNGIIRGDNVSVSDIRYKKNIETFKNALDKVSMLRGVRFEWKKEEFQSMNFQEGKQIGIIAQEAEEIIPELVDTDKDGYKSLKYSRITAVLIEAIKELKAENEALKARIAALETTSVK